MRATRARRRLGKLIRRANRTGEAIPLTHGGSTALLMSAKRYQDLVDGLEHVERAIAELNGGTR